ncbi:MAG: DUF6576 domain-containing protein [Acidimicrobiales bacterium]
MARFFSSPGFRDRDDGWFRVGTVEVTTTMLLVGLGVFGILLRALSPSTSNQLLFSSPLVRRGEVWRIVSWPAGLFGNAVFWSALSLFFLHVIGSQLERVVGRNRFLTFIALVVVVPALVCTVFNVAAGGMRYVSLPCFVGLALVYPNARSFFNIPLWVLAALFVAIDVLQLLGDRLTDQILFLFIGLGVGLLALRSFGVLEDVKWLPKLAMPRRGGGRSGPQSGSRRGPSRGRSGGKRKLKAVPNPPADAFRPPAPKPGEGLRQAELDMLLDKIAASGIESLTPEERRRLDEASRRLRDEKG